MHSLQAIRLPTTIIRMLARTLFSLAVELREKTGADIKYINLSGGIGVAYRPEQEENDIFAIGEGVRQALRGGSGSGRHGRRCDFYGAWPLHAGPSRVTDCKGYCTRSTPIRSISAWMPARRT